MNNTDKIKECLLLAQSALSDIERSKKDQALKRFEENGGCKSCRGRGWVVTWDTLDSMSGCYAEYGDCDAEGCTSESRSASGMNPRNCKYDRNRGTCWVAQYSDAELEAISSLQDKIEHLDNDLRAEIAKWTPRENVIVNVARRAGGRKDRRTPVGVSGLVKKRFRNQWGTEKLLIVDSDGKKWWPALGQVDVVDPDPDLDSWTNIDIEERKREGYPVIATIEKKTTKAALVKTITGVKFWIPISQVPEIKDAKKNIPMSIMIPMWLAINNNLVVSQ